MEFQYVLLLFGAVFIGMASCSHDAYLDGVSKSIQGASNKRRYCGDNLSRTLSVVCSGTYNTLYRNTDAYMTRSRSRRAANQNANLEYPFKSKESAKQVISSRRRKPRGVFNECCEKPCSREELATYCGGRKRR